MAALTSSNSLVPYISNPTPVSRRPQNSHLNAYHKNDQQATKFDTFIEELDECRYYVDSGYSPDTYNSGFDTISRDMNKIGVLIDTYI